MSNFWNYNKTSSIGVDHPLGPVNFLWMGPGFHDLDNEPHSPPKINQVKEHTETDVKPLKNSSVQIRFGTTTHPHESPEFDTVWKIGEISKKNDGC